MLRLLGMWLAGLTALPALVLAIHASEAGVVDWYKPLVGNALTGNAHAAPVFHRTSLENGNTKSLVLTATSSNVLAALHPENGSIGACALRDKTCAETLMTDDKFSVETFV